MCEGGGRGGERGLVLSAEAGAHCTGVCMFITAGPITKLFAGRARVCVFVTAQVFVCVVCVCGLWDRCVFYYCRTYYKAVRVGGGGEWRTCAISIQYSVILIRGNGVTLRTQKVIQGGDNGHVGRPCEVSLAPPCPELFCELRGLCRHSYFGPRTCGRSEKPKSSKWRGPNPGFQRNPSPP